MRLVQGGAITADLEVWILVIPGRPPNLANARLHHMARYRLCREYADLTWAKAIIARGKSPQATTKRKVEAVVYLSGVPRDSDNLVAGLKSGLDSLGTVRKGKSGPKAGLIVDDSPEWCDLEVRQERVAHRREECVIWTITESEP